MLLGNPQRDSTGKNLEPRDPPGYTQSHRSVGRRSDKTLEAGRRSAIPSEVATNVIGWSVAEHLD
jgi:hypothetical protein